MIRFEVAGNPETKGSAKAFRHRSSGKIIVRNDNPRCQAWAALVGWHARRAMGPAPLLAGPVRVVAEFRLVRPKTTKLAAPRLDLDKLVRAGLDALTGVVFVDDRQVVAITATKAWAEATRPAGVTITIDERTAP